MDLPRGVAERIAALFPGSRIDQVEALGPDAGTGAATAKGGGYGAPLRIDLTEGSGARRSLVFRTATPNVFGHDRRADRAEQMLLLYDTAGSIPKHAPVRDVGAVAWSGSLVPVSDCNEFYLITDYVNGVIYAEDLRRLARTADLCELDLKRCDALARYLASLHGERGTNPDVYRRSIRDLVGHGEGIYGVIDGYPDQVPFAEPTRLRSIERACAEYRWRLRGREQRLRRMHGDFHPFNIVFSEEEQFSLLDASRGCLGDPADDVTCLAVNYVFFALERPAAWKQGLRVLWHEFFAEYGKLTGDRELFDVAPPYLAWRCLVLANPRFYPALSGEGRNRLLRFVEKVLAVGRLVPSEADEVFR